MVNGHGNFSLFCSYLTNFHHHHHHQGLNNNNNNNNYNKNLSLLVPMKEVDVGVGSSVKYMNDSIYQLNEFFNINENLLSKNIYCVSESGINNCTHSINWTIESGTNLDGNLNHDQSGGQSGYPGKALIIPLYTLIFFLSFIGNLLVIVTLAINRRMRTVTNVFLLNLAISDLLLGVLCMPVTLIGQVLRNFIFGDIMCKIIPYFQAVSVSVGVWTLVAISLERYFAICRPLQSRKWQTRSHAYKMIVAVWIATLTWNIPITFVSQLQPIRDTGRYKCREIWPNSTSEKIFNMTLNFLLLLIPLCIMGMAYSLIVTKLWKGLRREILHTKSFRQQGSRETIPEENGSLELSGHSHSAYSMVRLPTVTSSGQTNTLRITPSREGNNISNEILTLKSGKGVVVRWKRKNVVEVGDEGGGTTKTTLSQRTLENNSSSSNQLHTKNTLSIGVGVKSTNSRAPPPPPPTPRGLKFSRAIRSTYTGRSIESKKKIIRMLFVLVTEFFVCWTPLYVMHTWYLHSPDDVYSALSPVGVSLIQLLAYVSSCCNPITYCFMNRKFRQSFLKLFQCAIVPIGKTGAPTNERGSDLSGNESLIFGVQGSTLNKSEVVVLECEERV